MFIVQNDPSPIRLAYSRFRNFLTGPVSRAQCRPATRRQVALAMREKR